MAEQNLYPLESLSKASEDNEVAGFVGKAFDILKMRQYEKIIYWAPNGLEFIIKDVVRFEEIVLPRFFRHNRMNSFVRQLNMYGFHKTKHNCFKSTFKHQYFQRNRDDLLPLVKRKLKNLEREQELEQEVKPMKPIVIEKVQPYFNKENEQVTMAHEKWINMSQSFLATTRLINMSLIKVSCNDLPEMNNSIFEEEDGCVSLDGQVQPQEVNEDFDIFNFQNPSCFFSSRFNV